MQRWVGCVRIEGFYAGVEAENGAVAPFAVADAKAIRDACPAARRAGVAPGTPLAMARRMCGGLHLIPYEARRYQAPANRWMRLGLDHAPWLEPLAPHEAFLDLSGHPDPEGALREVHAAVARLGFSARAAAAPNKLVARAAVQAKDALNEAVTLVPPGAEAAFLAPHSVRALWPLGEKTIARLERLEYANVAEVAAATVADLKAQIGREAALVHSLARGRYPDPVRPLFPEETIRARVRWTEGLKREDHLLYAVDTLARSVAEGLGGRCCRVLSLTLELEDRTRLEVRETRRMADRRNIPFVAARLAGRMTPSAPVMGVALVAAALTDPPPLEGDLFTLDRIRRQRALAEATLCLEERFGKRILFSCADVPIPWRERAWEAFWVRVRGQEGRSQDPGVRIQFRRPC